MPQIALALVLGVACLPDAPKRPDVVDTETGTPDTEADADSDTDPPTECTPSSALPNLVLDPNALPSATDAQTYDMDGDGQV